MLAKFVDIPDVEVFSVGQHKGKSYTEADLDAMVDNFRKFSSGGKRMVQVPAVIGHEETQPLMDNTGIPKVGRLDTLEKKTIPCEWCQGSGIFKAAEDNIKCPGCGGEGKRTVLLSQLGEVHPKIADLIKNRNYDRGSLEVYDNPPENIPGKGKMARRFALLGGQLPQIKDLTALPTTFAESKPRDVRIKFGKVINCGNGIFQVFSELVPVGQKSIKESSMDRQSMLAALDQAGIDISTFTPENMTDEALKSLYESINPPVANNEDPTNALLNPSTGDDMVKKMAERRRRFSEYCKKMAADYEAPQAMKLGVTDDKATEATKQPTNYTEEGGDVSGKNTKGQLAALGMGVENRSKYDSANHAEKFSEDYKKNPAGAIFSMFGDLRQELLSSVKPAQDTVQRFTEETERATVQTFCENMFKAGRLDAKDLDGTNPKVRSQIDRLMSLDNKTPVTKFSENGKTVTLTARQEAMEEIRQRPARSRGEQVKVRGTGVTKFSETVDREVSEVADHWESFAEDFNRVSTSKDEFVNAFKAEKKINQRLTADDYNARTKLQTA